MSCSTTIVSHTLKNGKSVFEWRQDLKSNHQSFFFIQIPSLLQKFILKQFPKKMPRKGGKAWSAAKKWPAIAWYQHRDSPPYTLTKFKTKKCVDPWGAVRSKCLEESPWLQHIGKQSRKDLARYGYYTRCLGKVMVGKKRIGCAQWAIGQKKVKKQK